MRKIFMVMAAAATLATAAVSVPSDAQARWRGHHGGAVAAGVFGGLAAGALIGSAFANPYYGSGYYPAYGYGYGPAYGYSPVYAEPACYIRRERVCDPYRGCWVQRVRTC